ncbi:MAG TPA: GIY-YIG nuclease family protein [bacterium]|nr:GIY-YIG nuclease family protein [bacterium]
MASWHWFVYIIECIDGLYYTGMTCDLDKRLEQHRVGKGSNFTTKHGFKKLKYFEEFTDINEARRRENQLKDFSRKKKEALWN